MQLTKNNIANGVWDSSAGTLEEKRHVLTGFIGGIVIAAFNFVLAYGAFFR